MFGAARKSLAFVALAALALGACSSESVSNTESAATGAKSTVADDKAETTAAANGDEQSSAAEADQADAAIQQGEFAKQWTKVDAPADCMCGDGSPYSYFVREKVPTKVVFFLEGGGACFTADTCKPGSDSYKQSVGQQNGFMESQGIFDLDNPENPLADYSMVYVPYCTGDVHGGNTTTDYGNGVVVQHKGLVNGTAAMNALLERFPEATDVIVAGASAGSFPTPIYAGMIADKLPRAAVKVLADGSGAIPDAMGLVASQWKLFDALPRWPEVQAAQPAQLTPSWVFEITAHHNPSIVFARHDYAFDATLARYAELAGVPPEDLVALMDANEKKVEAAGTQVATWVAPGDSHTILSSSGLYAEELNGERFATWLGDFVNGTVPADQHCTVCS